MLNLKSNFVLAGVISAAALLTGMGFTSGAMALTGSKHDSNSSSGWGNSCPSDYHYDYHKHKCVKDRSDSDSHSNKSDCHGSKSDSRSSSSDHHDSSSDHHGSNSDHHDSNFSKK